jgi:hypothetical protein
MEYLPGTKHWQMASLENELRNVETILTEIIPTINAEMRDKERKYWDAYKSSLLTQIMELGILDDN